MNTFKVDVLQVRKNPYELGYLLGKKFYKTKILKQLEFITKKEINLVEMKALYRTFSPHLLDELEGIAEGLQYSFCKTAALISGYDVPKLPAMGCTTYCTKNYYVRNYDFGPDLYDGVFTLYQNEQRNSYALAGYNLQLIGRHDGVNEKGLVAGFHFVNNEDYQVGISPWVIVRMILDTCSSVEEAILLLREIPHAACYNYSIADKLGNIAAIEATPNKMVVRYEEDYLSCVNHFQASELKEKNRSIIDGSIKREQYLSSFKNKEHLHEDMHALFKDMNSPVFFTDYDQLFGTLHTFSYSFTKDHILTTVAKGKKDLSFYFKDWLNGQNLEDTSIIGDIGSRNS
ncbi:C45 family autoproteolytic acyltransferase/hydolase [Bacillus sp. B1-b2]|uniref:C45 family autoproteolytic acyltransferase/hydolase n=1 Tax=Bacillus sp. B1-b2 TaxID=2653201 RepID=UPI0012619718|nr:C45 family peptidase [Bacillus sp. B1-b2]KAB7663646.1 linear amide C-N hydrolase [Bacillus sp. B1-b2]